MTNITGQEIGKAFAWFAIERLTGLHSVLKFTDVEDLQPSEQRLVRYYWSGPLHTHDCERCIYLGRYLPDDVDLYYCGQGGMSTVLARYGSLGHQYTSGLQGAVGSPWLFEAKRLAIAQGYLQEPQS